MKVIVTGASRGVGYEVVRAFAGSPDCEVLAVSRNREALIALQDRCRQEGLPGSVEVLAADLAQDHVQEGLIKALLDFGDPVDLLINNAGTLVNKPFEQLSDADFRTLFNVNVRAAFRMVQWLAPRMGKGSHIVNISSMGGFQGSMKFPGLSLYSASKGALAVLTEALAVELADRGIAVNCLAFGAVQTEMLSEAFPGYQAPVTAHEMGQFVKQFAETGHHFINGKIIPVSMSVP